MITFLIASTGRPSLRQTLASIECWPGDEILVVGALGDIEDGRVRLIPHLPAGDWGHTERNVGMPFATGRYLAHIDDDDIYVPGTRARMADVIAEHPDRPILFRMQYPSGFTLWLDPVLRMGNVGTPMMLLPNVPEKLGTFGSFHGGDFAFLANSHWTEADYVWRPETTVLLGHNA